MTGFHRRIGLLARPELVEPAIHILALCAKLEVAVAVGAPTFGPEGSKYITHLLIDETGNLKASVSKSGLTEVEATFFSRGGNRPIGNLQGLRCSAVADAGQSAVVSPEGELLFRLPKEASGVGIFRLGDRSYEWHPQ